MDERGINLEHLYPNLIILLSPNKNESLFKQLKQNFSDFCYGPIFKQEGTSYKFGRQISTCRVMQGDREPVCLAEGEGTLPCDAEVQAVETLFQKLCDSFYVIQPNPDYFSKKKVPTFALDVDPMNSHIYRVVYLRNNSQGVPFPWPVTGAFEYVENYNELLEYIEAHGKSVSSADLFILNVLKSDRGRIKQVCQTNGLQTRNLVGCSDRGMHAYRNMSTPLILQELLKAGGKTVKYKLVGPRPRFGEIEARVNRIKEEKTDQSQDSTDEDKEIVINPWIADRLVLMEVVNEYNELESTKEIIWQSVRSCPDTQEFIIEKKRNNAGMISAEAMIDRNVVGRARGFKENEVKAAAAENAMQNLSRYCYYIEAKKSYFGTNQTSLPNFLTQRITPNRLYRIAEKNEGPPNKILQQFKSAWQEDLYFMCNFTDAERENILRLAKSMKFLVRWIGGGNCLCVSKKMKPNEILMELMATSSKENEKYKLITPPAKALQQPGEGASQDWNNRRTSHDNQLNTQPLSRGVGPSNHTLVRPQANTSGQQPPHGVASQSCPQGSQTSVSNETENWVMNYIKSESSKQDDSLKGPPTDRQRDNLNFKYNSTPPNQTPHSTYNLNMNSQGADQGQERIKINNGFPYKERGDIQHVSSEKSLGHETSNERVSKAFEGHREQGNQHLKNVGNEMESSNQASKTAKFSPEQKKRKFTFAKLGESSNNYSEGETGMEPDKRARTWWNGNNSNKGLKERAEVEKRDCTFTENPRFQEEDRFKNSSQPMFDHQNRHFGDDGPSIKVEDEFQKDASQLFQRRPESTQHKTSYWNSDIKQQYDQRFNTSTTGQRNSSSLYHNDGSQNFKTQGITAATRNYSSLFDYNGSQNAESQGPSTSKFPPRPPPPWKKNKQFKGHSFSKLAKYGKKGGAAHKKF